MSEPVTTPSGDRRAGVVGGATVAVGLGVMNVATYGLTLACARLLGPDGFGQFSSVLGALIVVNVVSLALQATGARRVSTAVGDPAVVVATVRRAGRRAAVVVTVLGLLAAPLVARGLRLESVVGALALAVAAGLLTLMGTQAGLLQGAHRWRALAAVFAAMGAARLVVGLAALLVDRSATAALVGVAVGAAVPVAVGALALAPRPGARTLPRRPAPTADPVAGVGPEVLHSGVALFAFFAVSNVDVLLARAVLPPVEAGHYAAGLVLTKALLFLPQVVVVVLFPRLARGHDVRRTHLGGLAAILGIGAVAAAGVALLRGLALEFVGGAAYAAVAPDLWVFAALGTVLAMVQLLVYGALARRHPRAVLLLWPALAATAGLALLTSTARSLLLVKLGVDVVLLLALAAVLLARPAADPTPAPASGGRDADEADDPLPSTAR